MTVDAARRAIADWTAINPLAGRAVERSAALREPRLANVLLLQIATLLFLAPSAILGIKFSGIAGVSTLLGCGACAYLALTIRARADGLLNQAIDFRSLAGFFLLSVILLLLGGAAHVFTPTPDWYVRDAVLADLSLRGFPITYRLDDADYFLRAPLGYYLTPAMIGNMLGLYAAHVAALAQNAVVLSIILYFLAKIADVSALVFSLVFLAFGWADQLIQMVYIIKDIQHWWNPLLFRYMSNLTLLFWAPNHLLPAWWFAVLVLLASRREIDLAATGVSFAFLILWSPLAMMGGAPFLILHAVGEGRSRLFSARLILGLIAALCFAPIAIYLTRDAGSVEHKWLIGETGFLALYVVFIAVEIPRAGLFFAAWPKLASVDRRLLLLSATILCLIPFYSLGHFNDFAERACQTPLAIVAFNFARLFCVTPRDGKPLSLAILTLTVWTSFEGAFEIRYPLVTPTYPISDCNLTTAGFQQYPDLKLTHYLARVQAAPAWLGPLDGPRLQVEQKACWPKGPAAAPP
jgi:hypothetical protein